MRKKKKIILLLFVIIVGILWFLIIPQVKLYNQREHHEKFVCYYPDSIEEACSDIGDPISLTTIKQESDIKKLEFSNVTYFEKKQQISFSIIYREKDIPKYQSLEVKIYREGGQMLGPVHYIGSDLIQNYKIDKCYYNLEEPIQSNDEYYVVISIGEKEIAKLTFEK